MDKTFFWLIGMCIPLGIFMLMPSKGAQIDANVCEGGVLSKMARYDAVNAGYTINQQYNCIDKSSFLAVNAANAKYNVASSSHHHETVQTQPIQTLAEARQGFVTHLGYPTPNILPLPNPPADLFVRADYKNNKGSTLAAFVTTNPNDGKKHPAIIWLTGGETNSLSDFWQEGAASNDQSASAFRQAGVIMMFPTLRGGNRNGGNQEFFYGEVDDVLAAAEQLARLPYVDASQIYLGGHSTGGTLALLTGEISTRFNAIFALGAAETVDHYGPQVTPIMFSHEDEQELRLRSPRYWLESIKSPMYLFEGTESPSNIDALNSMCRDTHNPELHCIPVSGKDHFSEILPVTRSIAAQIILASTGATFRLPAEQFSR